MSKLANHIVLFCSHDNIGYLVKYIDTILGMDQYTSPGIQHYHVSKIKQYDWLMGIINELSLRCNISNPIMRTEQGFKSSHFGSCPRRRSNCADLKKPSPVLVVGSEILHII
jgi:hypothetical protein